jgi:hypothetical protein
VAAEVNAHRGLGAIYEAAESLSKAADELFAGVENDIPAVTLSQQAMEIRLSASRLESTLDAVVNALDNLG